MLHKNHYTLLYNVKDTQYSNAERRNVDVNVAVDLSVYSVMITLSLYKLQGSQTRQMRDKVISGLDIFKKMLNLDNV